MAAWIIECLIHAIADAYEPWIGATRPFYYAISFHWTVSTLSYNTRHSCQPSHCYCQSCINYYMSYSLKFSPRICPLIMTIVWGSYHMALAPLIAVAVACVHARWMGTQSELKVKHWLRIPISWIHKWLHNELACIEWPLTIPRGHDWPD